MKSMAVLSCGMFSASRVSSAGYEYFFIDLVFGFVRYCSAVITYMQDR